MAGQELVGRTVGGHYRLEAILGRGGAGIVFRAHHELLDQEFAVKVLHPAMSHDQLLRTRLLREAKSLTRFTHHNAVQMRHCGEEDDGLLYIVMDLCAGETLSRILKTEGRLEEPRARSITLSVLDALSSAHAAGIVHRDLKPANIMVDHDRVKVVDFGLARALHADTDVTAAGGVVGTVGYMAPEQLRAEEVDGRADLFSLGVILHEMLSGKRAFGDGSFVTVMPRILHEPPAPLPENGISARTRAAVKRALEKDPSRRFESAEEFASAIREERRIGETPPKRDRTRMLFLGMVLLVAVLLGFGAVAWMGRRATDRLRRRARAVALAGRFEETIAIQSEILRRRDATALDHLARGKTRTRLRRTTAAKDLSRAEEMLGETPAVLTAWGRYRWRVDHDTKAANLAFRRALEIDAKLLEPRILRLEMLCVSNRPLARTELERLGTLFPDSPYLDIFSSAIAVADGNNERARADAQRAAGKDDRLADAALQVSRALHAWAQSLHARGDHPSARERSREGLRWAQKAIELARQHPAHRDQGLRLPAYYRQSLAIRERLGDADGAREILETLLELNPTDPKTIHDIARTYTWIGDYEAAVALYERLLDVATDDPSHHFRLGFSLQEIARHQGIRGELEQAQGNLDRALEAYDRGLLLKPDDPELHAYSGEAATLRARFSQGRDRTNALAGARAHFGAIPDDAYDFRRAYYFHVAGQPEEALKRMERIGQSTGPAAMTARMWGDLALYRIVVAARLRDEPLLDKAIEAAERVKLVDPVTSAASGWILHGDALRLRARWRKEVPLLEHARRAYAKAVEHSERRPLRRAEAHFLAAEVLLDLSRPDEAVEQARLGLDIHEGQARKKRWFRLASDYQRCARILARAGREKEAERLRQKAQVTGR